MEKIGAFTDRVTSAGEWRNGDPTSNVRATPMLAAYFNMLQRELVGVVEGAGLTLDINDDRQLFKAITALASGSYLPRLASIPAQRIPGSDEIYVAGWGEMVWVETEFFVGYRSPLCGRPVDGHTNQPLLREIDAVGGLADKQVYAGLWGYAREEGLVVTQAEWDANRGGHLFVDVNATQFRTPDLRDMFRRYAGTDADTANARALGSMQLDAFQGHEHIVTGHRQLVSNTSTGPMLNDAGNDEALVQRARRIVADSVNGVPRVSSETRPVNVAYLPRLHV